MEIRDVIKQEYKKCYENPVYFIKKYCYIQHPQRGKIKFELYPFQEETLLEMFENRFNIILKSRQLGISTLTAAYSLWLAQFFNDKNILVIATKQSVAKNLVTKIREMHKALPSWLKARTEENNKMSMRFTNGSQIKAESTSESAGRSEALSLLVIDEAAFIDNIGTIWAAAYQTLATGGRAIVLSTPNGVGNWFHKMWIDAEAGINNFNPIKLHWSVHPERNQNWRDDQDKDLGKRLAAQECDTDFLSSGNTVIDPEILNRFQTNIIEPYEKRGYSRELWIWEPPDYTRDYIVVADVARGDGTDYSAFHVFDVESVTQVAEFKGMIPTKDFGNMLVNVATEYNTALLVIENANVGWAAIQPAIDRAYSNLYYSVRMTNYAVDTEVLLEKGYDLKDKSQMVPGFTTSTRSRPMIISKMEMYLRENACILHSRRLMDELGVFIWGQDQKPQAQRGYNDDLVLAFAIAMFVRDTALKLRQQGIELTKSTINSFSTSVLSNRHNNTFVEDPWRMDTGFGTSEDLTWLIDSR